jgi:hypothetical protein
MPPPETATPPPDVKGGGLSLRQMLEREGLLLALASALGTLATYLFEAGRFSFYGIPEGLIELDVGKIIAASFAIVLFFFMIAVALIAITDLISARHPGAKAVGEAIILIPLFGPLLFLVDADRAVWAGVAGGAAVILLNNFARPLFGRVANQTYWDRMSELQAKNDARVERKPRSGVGLLDTTIMPSAVIIVLLLVIVFSVGRYAASIRTTHWVPTDDPTLLLAATRADTLIFKAYDPRTATLQDRLVIRKVRDDVDTRLVLRTTGRLHPASSAAASHPEDQAAQPRPN